MVLFVIHYCYQEIMYYQDSVQDPRASSFLCPYHSNTMTPIEVIACFQAVQDIFVGITGKPLDEDIVCIREIHTTILLSILIQ